MTTVMQIIHNSGAVRRWLEDGMRTYNKDALIQRLTSINLTVEISDTGPFIVAAQVKTDRRKHPDVMIAMHSDDANCPFGSYLNSISMSRRVSYNCTSWYLDSAGTKQLLEDGFHVASLCTEFADRSA